MIKNTAKQNEFLEAFRQGKNIFLTGNAGTGKSEIIRQAIAEGKILGKKLVAVAPTGIAAMNIEGVTIHSLFSIPPFGIHSLESCQFMTSGKRSLLRKVDTIVIDEVSMLRPDLLDAIHLTLKKNGLDGLTKGRSFLLVTWHSFRRSLMTMKELCCIKSMTVTISCLQIFTSN